MNTYGKKESGSKAKLYWVIGIIIAIAVAALLIWNSGIFEKGSTAAKVGDQEYSIAQMSYYYKSVANSQIQMAQKYKQFGIDSGYDTEKSPSEQMYNEDENKTYADYFLETALDQLKRVSILCDQANKEGYTLSDDGKAQVEANFAALHQYSVQSGYSESAYLKLLYGKYMTKSLFREMVTNAVLADEYAQSKSEQFTYPDDQLNTYYNENKDSLDTYDYRFCYINYTTEEKTDDDGNPVDPTDEEIAAAMSEANAKANQMIGQIQAGTPFNTAAAQFLDETSAASYSEDPEYNHYSSALGNTLTSPYSEWLMDAARQPGDITALEVANTGYCVVQFLGRSTGDDNYQTRDYSNLLVMAETTEGEDGTSAPTEDQLAAAKTQAEDLLKQFTDGDKTADAFADLAKANSADEVTRDNGGLTEKANRDSLSSNVSSWLFAADRQTGDTTIVEHTDDNGTVVGYEILLAGNAGEIAWKYQALNTLRSEDYNKWYEGIEGEYTAELTDAAQTIPAL